MKSRFLALILCLVFGSFAQTKDAYEGGKDKAFGLFDPSRLTINHSLSFGMASTSGLSNSKSLSQYSTMLQYNFVAPVTLTLNFSLPIHSTFSSANNLTTSNLQSLEYFKNIPFDVSVTWKPSENLHFSFNVARYSENNFYQDNYSPFPFDSYSNRLLQKKF